MMKEKEKRIVRGYKIAHTPYARAMKQASRDKLKLASLIEEWVKEYGECGSVVRFPVKSHS